MMTRPGLTLGRLLICLVALVAIPACSLTTAHLTDLKIGKDKDVTTEATAFAPADTVYAESGVANTPSKVTLVWHLTAVNVKGQKPNAKVSQLDRSFDLASDGTSSYTLTPPPTG